MPSSWPKRYFVGRVWYACSGVNPCLHAAFSSGAGLFHDFIDLTSGVAWIWVQGSAPLRNALSRESGWGFLQLPLSKVGSPGQACLIKPESLNNNRLTPFCTVVLTSPFRTRTCCQPSCSQTTPEQKHELIPPLPPLSRGRKWWNKPFSLVGTHSHARREAYRVSHYTTPLVKSDYLSLLLTRACTILVRNR